jgi:diguanylate cyclase (GGDEF)-like protein
VLSKLVDIIIGSPDAYEAHQRIRVRVSVTALLAIALSFVATFLLWLLIVDDRQLIGYSAFLAGMSSFGGALYIFYKTKSLQALSNAFCFSMGVMIVTTATLTGGFASPILNMFLLLPVLALITSGISHGLLWAGLIFIVYFVLVYLHQLGVELPILMNYDNFALIQAILWVFSSGVIILVLMLQEYFNRQLAQRLYRDKQHYENLSMTDGLTGLHNRVYFDRIVENLSQHHSLTGIGFSMFFLDLNKFKQVNDTHGHAAGDYILQEVATRLAQTFRKGDHLIRMGGDEFAVIVEEELSDEEALQLGRKLQDALAEEVYYDREFIVISGSVGISHFPAHGDTVESVMACADRAMYEGKNDASCLVLASQ